MTKKKKSPCGPPPLDIEEYRDDIADLNLTEEQERAFLEALWSIMKSFVELGFTMDICGQIFGEFNSASGALPDALDLADTDSKETPSNGKRKGGRS